MATNVESTAPVDAESSVINLLALLRTRVDKEFNSIQTHLNERRTVLLAQINTLEQKYTQSTEAATDKKLLEQTKNDLKVPTRLAELYESTFKQMDIDLRKLSAQIVEFSNIALQIDSSELMESIDKLGHLSYECKVNYDNRKIPFMTTRLKIKTSIYLDDFCLTCDGNDNVYIASYSANSINVYTADGVYVKSLPAEQPVGVCIRNNTLYVSELKSHTICKMNTDGSSVKRIGAEGTEFGQFKYPGGLTTNTGYLFVCDQYNHRLQVLSHELQPIRIIQTEHMKHPRDININNNALFVLNNCKCILVISVEGQFLKLLASIQDYVTRACHFCIDTASNILISDCDGSRIQVFSILGQYLHTLGEEMNTSTQKPYCYYPLRICILSTGVVASCNKQGCLQLF